jgi:CheY-like chemotaxis protein
MCESERPRIIALTANVFKTDQDACTDAGMDGFLGKPMDLKQLRDALLLCAPVNRQQLDKTA